MKKFNSLSLLNNLFLAIALLIALPSISQMSGVYTINSGAAASSTNFTSFTSAAASLKLNGVNGAVTINVVASSGPYFEQVKIDTIPGVSVIRKVTINGNGNKITSLPNATNLYMLRLNGAKHVTINNLVLYDSSDTYGWGIHFINGADSNTIDGCTVDMTKNTTTSSTTSIGIIATNSTTVPTALGASGSYNIIKNNTVKGGLNGGLYYGIRMNGASNSTGCEGNQVLDNTFLDSYIYNIYLYFASNTIIRGNSVSRPNKITVSSFYGIYLSTGVIGTLASNNRIFNSNGSASSLASTVGCIYILADGTASSPNIFYNNLIYNINSTATIYGVYNSGADYLKCYFNTISFDNSSVVATGVTYGFYQNGTASGLEFLNNIMTISRGGSGTKYCLYWSTNTSTLLSDKNDLYMNASSGSNYIGYWNATSYSTLTDWKTANSNAFDQSSQSVDPLYAAPASANFKPATSQINNIASVISGITTDILGITRNSLTPDPGAYEFTPVTDDAGLTAFVSPLAACPGSVNVGVTLKNFGAVTMDSVRINWSINGVLQTMYKHTSSLTILASTNVTIGSFTVVGGNTYNIKVWASNPNGTNDGNAANDTLLMPGLQSGLSGTYTIGSSGDFPTIAAAVAALNNRDVCGNVIFNINPSSGPYKGKLNIGPLDGTSASKTVKFMGHGATMFDTTDAASYFLVMLNGASYVTIDSLTIQNIGITYGYGVLLTNNSNWNTISNCYINMASCTSTTATASAGIVISGSAATQVASGNNGNYNTFFNNTIDGGVTNPGLYYGIALYGNSGGGNGNRGNKVLNNTIRNTYVYNIYSAYGDSVIIDKNDITRLTKTAVTTFYGIFLNTGSMRTIVSNNRIHNTHDNAVVTSGSIYGIYSVADATVGNENKIYNNLLYDFNGATSTIYALYNNGGDFTEYYYNTLSLDYTASTSGTVYAFYQPSAATNVIVRNNVFSVTKGGSGTKYGLYYNSASTNQESNKNVVYMGSQGSGAQYFGYWGAAVGTFSAWKAVNSGAFDQSSDSTSPEFTNISTDNYLPNSFTANNIGSAISGITTDLSGATRNATTPDPGVYEFTPIPSNDSCSKAITVGVGSVNGTTIGATTDFAPTCVVADAPSGGVWYKYTSPGHYVIASLCGSSYDTRMRIFTGSCASLTCVTGNENFCGSQSQTSGCADSNETYYLLVYGNGSAVGNFTLNVSEIPVQQATITASGSTSFCPGDSVVLNAGTNNGTYEWNDSVMSTSQSITVFGTGNFQVVTTDTNGCVDSSNMITTTAHSVTQAIIIASGPTELCEGDTVFLASNTSTSYLWSDSSIGQTVVVTATGVYTVTTTDSNGCESTSAPASIQVNDLPVTSLGNDTTICHDQSIALDAGPGFVHYNWSTGDTTQTINFSESVAGNYPVSVTISDTNDCEGVDELVVAVEICGGIDESNDLASISVYPNPANDLVNVVFAGFAERNAQLNITDGRGSVIYSNIVPVAENHVIDLASFSPGLYILKVTGGDQVKTIRLIVE